MLVDKITGAQRGNQKDMLFLIEKFCPLLKRYGYKLHKEDAYNNLLLDFIELIHNINLDKLRRKDDGAIVKYIAVSIKNAYVARLRKILENNNCETAWDDLSEKEQYTLLSDSPTLINKMDISDFLSGFPNLTDREVHVLIFVYQYGYSSTEIALKLKTSKQNVNQTKLRALRKIRLQLEES